MIYISLYESASISERGDIRITDIAKVRDDGGRSRDISALTLKTRVYAEIIAIDALDAIDAIRTAFPDDEVISVGEPRVWVRRKTPEKPMSLAKKWITAGIASVTLMCGAGMAITYFHADVDMRGAQKSLIDAISPGADERWMSVPYSLGVGVGVLAFFRLFGGKTPSPLELKLKDWEKQVEEFSRDKATENRQ